MNVIPKEWEPIDEEVLVIVAQIIGEHSAALAALKEAAERRARGEKVSFYKYGRTFIVVGEK